jgi:hypothetical protein
MDVMNDAEEANDQNGLRELGQVLKRFTHCSHYALSIFMSKNRSKFYMRLHFPHIFIAIQIISSHHYTDSIHYPLHNP